MAKHVYPKPSIIKSIQSGVISLGNKETKNVTVNAVNMEKSILIMTSRMAEYYRIKLINSTTIQAINSSSSTTVRSLSYFLIEFNDILPIPTNGFNSYPEDISGIKSIQNVSITIPVDQSSGTATINTVDVNKTFLIGNGDDLSYLLMYTLENSNTVKATRSYNPSNVNNGEVVVVEFY